eukprot:820085-Pelagomonas_calceolata.AAC.3
MPDGTDLRSKKNADRTDLHVYFRWAWHETQDMVTNSTPHIGDRAFLSANLERLAAKGREGSKALNLLDQVNTPQGNLWNHHEAYISNEAHGILYVRHLTNAMQKVQQGAQLGMYRCQRSAEGSKFFASSGKSFVKKIERKPTTWIMQDTHFFECEI